MTDAEKTVKINEVVESCCTSWNGHMKEALKNAMNAIVYTDSDAESYEAYKSVQTIVAFMEDSFFLDERQSSKLSDFAADLYYGYC